MGSQDLKEKGAGAAPDILELTSVETRDSGFFARKPKGLEIYLQADASCPGSTHAIAIG
jgi:hypothetical protein